MSISCVTCAEGDHLYPMNEEDLTILVYLLHPQFLIHLEDLKQTNDVEIIKICLKCREHIRRIDVFRKSAMKNFLQLIDVWEKKPTIEQLETSEDLKQTECYLNPTENIKDPLSTAVDVNSEYIIPTPLDPLTEELIIKDESINSDDENEHETDKSKTMLDNVLQNMFVDEAPPSPKTSCESRMIKMEIEVESDTEENNVLDQIVDITSGDISVEPQTLKQEPELQPPTMMDKELISLQEMTARLPPIPSNYKDTTQPNHQKTLQKPERDESNVDTAQRRGTISTGQLLVPTVQSEKSNLSCPTCNKTLPSSLSLKRHMANHINRVKMYCELCDKHFETQQAYAVHVSFCHNNERRSRKSSRTRKIGNTTGDIMQKALKAVRGGKAIRLAAYENNIAYATLRRYCVKYKNAELPARLTPNYAVRKIFTEDQEKSLHGYFKNCSLLFYGLTSKNYRSVAYEMAKLNNITIPESWEVNKMAGKDWLRGFRERFPDITLRRLEKTEEGKETVKRFYNDLENVISRNPAFADGTRIFNLDEIATSTVQRNPKVLSPKGRRNEKGMVTTCNIIGAGGQALPPALVFPRKEVNDRMRTGTPPGSLILASPSGWMNSDLFVDVMKHFIQRSGSSKDFPSVLIMDSHESHLSIEALDLAKDSGVTVLTLHPQLSAKLQPLDVGIYGPFETYYSSAMESWAMRNPGVPVTIYDVGGLVGEAFDKSMTPAKIKNSFRKTGIFPFDRDIFTEEDFMPGSDTDRAEGVGLDLEVEENAADTSADDHEQETMEIENIRDEEAQSPSMLEVIEENLN